MSQLIKQFLQEEDGVTAIEYGLIAALVAIVIVAAVAASGQSLLTLWNKISTCLNNAVGGLGC